MKRIGYVLVVNTYFCSIVSLIGLGDYISAIFFYLIKYFEDKN